MLSILRQRLQAITEITDVTAHPRLIDQLRSETEHSIITIESSVPLERYTCAVFAFDLVEDPTYIEIAEYGIGGTFAGKDFVRFLIENRLLLADPHGDLALYFMDQEFEHIGKFVTSDRIASKWGCGCLLEHGIWEVPSSYGTAIRRFTISSTNSGLDLFVAYAQSRGFKFEPVNT